MPETEKNQIPEQPEFLTYSSFPSGKHEGKTHFIIVGAGIIGVCIAFYLTRHPKFDPKKHYITIIESKRVAGGASGKAGGLLALWAFPQQIVPLSFQLHQELSDEFNGEKEWGYRRLTTISVEGDISDANLARIKERESDPSKTTETNKDNKNSTATSTSAPTTTTTNNKDEPVVAQTETKSAPSRTKSAKQIKKNSIEITSETTNEDGNDSGVPALPKDLNWLNASVIQDWNQLGNESTTAQVHPYQFTTFILKQCILTGAVELIIGKVDDIIIDEDSGDCKGVFYYPSSAQLENSEVSEEKLELYGDQVIMSIGPWTSKILPDCPISGLRAHSITVAPKDVDEVSPYAVFTELKLNSPDDPTPTSGSSADGSNAGLQQQQAKQQQTKFVSPEIYARKDEVYVCGEGDSSVLIPDTTDDVEIVTEKCDELFKNVSKISKTIANGKILKRQACYLPVLDIPSSSGPLIGETNVENLYLASGHSCWGINNAPATGLLISELLLDGEARSCDISALNPGLYFDASLVYDDEEDSEFDEEEEGEYDDDEGEEYESESE
ncbi:unnamed protein product [Ambrosiozyma monospora]|uniref:Unnamed protein product n=1 Tax=Ambrosiozyma monospora TaxID=43982 RepID=A0A9W6YRK1_AMBMO|nr:unnamed protein product [Ambrosiozyma monospora]